MLIWVKKYFGLKGSCKGNLNESMQYYSYVNEKKEGHLDRFLLVECGLIITRVIMSNS